MGQNKSSANQVFYLSISDEKIQNEYEKGIKINDLFREKQLESVTARDHMSIQMSAKKWTLVVREFEMLD